MKPTVYIETTIPSYLTAWPSKDIYILGQQQMTRKWWDQRDEFEMVTSRFVVGECQNGDPTAADDRLKAMQGIKLLPDSELTVQLAEKLIAEIPLPPKATIDAFHIAVSAVERINYLLTWNCRHIANATLRPRIEEICKAAGTVAPIICTPDELMLRRIADDVG